jgi:hypothetical protein
MGTRTGKPTDSRRRVLVAALVAVLALALAPAAHAQLLWSAPTLVDHQAAGATPVQINGISCPTETLCVAVDANGSVLTSTDPTGGVGAWTIAAVDAPNSLNAVSCPTTTFCVAVDSEGNVLTSSDPTGGADAWSFSYVDPNPGADLTAVSCGSATVCVVVDSTGNALTWNGTTWTSAAADSGNDLVSVSCPDANLCAAVDISGNVITSEHEWQLGGYAGGRRGRQSDLDLVRFGHAVRRRRRAGVHRCLKRPNGRFGRLGGPSQRRGSERIRSRVRAFEHGVH